MEAIILGILGTAGSAGLVAGVSKLFSLSTGQARIEQKLDDHIRDERRKFEVMGSQIEEYGRKLPNGELRRLLLKLDRLESHWVMKPRVKPNGRRRT